MSVKKNGMQVNILEKDVTPVNSQKMVVCG